MAKRHQRGWLKKEKRAQGETWVLFFRTTRKSDGKRVENKIPIGLVRCLPDARSAWTEVERLHCPVNGVDVRRGLTFGDLAQHYAEHELVECSESIRPKAHTTIKGYERVLRNRLLPRWGNRIALGIEPLEVEQWLRALKQEGHLANPTLDKTRRVMSLVYKHSQRYGLIPRNQESNPMRFVRCKTTSGYEEITETEWDEVLTVNLKSVFLVTQAVISGMRQRKWGRIINLSSVAAQTGRAVGAHYAASKARIVGLTHSCASAFVREGITVNVIAPALIETDMVTSNPNASPALIPMGHFGSVDDVASVVVMLAMNDYMTGQTISVNGGWYMS